MMYFLTLDQVFPGRVLKVLFPGRGWPWSRGLRGQKPCAIGIRGVHRRVDSRGPLRRSPVLVVDLLALGLDARGGRAVVGGRRRGGGIGAIAGAVGIGRAVALVAAGGEAEGQAENQDLVHRGAPVWGSRFNGPRQSLFPLARLLEG